MAVHDWSKVVAGNFHDFHQSWIIELRRALNRGLLPKGFYAMAEQAARGPIPDVLALQSKNLDEDSNWNDADKGAVRTLAKSPPKVRFVEAAEEDLYAARADRVVIRHVNGDRVVAYIEIVSFGNKSSAEPLDKFIDKLTEAIDRGCHLLVIDLHHPHIHDPRGIHAAFWEHVSSTAHGVTEAQPFGVSAYRAAFPPTAYFEPVGLGEALPDMPLFLSEDHYIDVPLEQTYMAAWSDTGEPWREFMKL